MPLEVKANASDEDKHELDITALLFHNNKLYSSADDGKIKIWDENLKLLGECQAHPCSVYSITASSDTLYSCSNDGSVKAWSLDNLQEKGTILQEESEMYKVYFDSGKLYVGDDAGIVRIFENDKMVGVLEIMHPIVELLAMGNLVYTARDLYVLISEVNPSTKRIATIKSIEGRAPVREIGGKLCFTTRGGKDILLYDNSKYSEFVQLGLIKDAHELIINALCPLTQDNEQYLCSGGWDKVVKRWKIADLASLQAADTCSVDMCVTAIATGSKGEVYVGGGDGRVVRLDIS